MLVVLAIIFSSCNEPVKVLNKNVLQLQRGKSYQLELEGATGTEDWVSTNPFAVTVTQTGKVTANYVGKSEILVEGQKCEVEVESLYGESILPYFVLDITFEEFMENSPVYNHAEILDREQFVYFEEWGSHNNMAYVFSDNQLLLLECYINEGMRPMVEKQLNERYKFHEKWNDSTFVFIDGEYMSEAKHCIVVGRYKYPVVTDLETPIIPDLEIKDDAYLQFTADMYILLKGICN